MDENMGTKRTASPGTGKIAAKSHEAAEQWKEAVVDQVNQVRDKAVSAREQTSDRMRGVATQFRQMSSTLREGDPMVADLADRAGQGVEAAARYVSSANAQTFVRDTERLARRQPALFFGGAFLLGLAAGRFLKSSAPSGSARYDAGPARRDEYDGYSPPTRQDRPSGFFPSSGAGDSDSNGTLPGAGTTMTTSNRTGTTGSGTTSSGTTGTGPGKGQLP